MEKIVNININQIFPHPDNPRKNVGDVSELAESIKKQGIMQNLTVIPLCALTENPENQPAAEDISEKSDFHVLIGHRRLEGAKKAGLSEVPCRIVSKISKKEQVAIMLEENMQRNDLTIYEQAQGFQMMLDLGETVDTIAEKTGFSETTIRHRLNIAKLDQKLLQNKQEDPSFQLSLKDLYELEKVKDIKTRNRILRESSNSSQLIWKAKDAVKEAEKAEKIKKIVGMLKPFGVEKAPDGTEWKFYSGGWETVKEIDLDKKLPEKISLKQDKEKLYYCSGYSTFYVVKKGNKKKNESAEEKKQKQKDRAKKHIREILKQTAGRRKEFIDNIISGNLPPVKDEEKVKDSIWEVLQSVGTYINNTGIFNFLTGKSRYECSDEEVKEAEEKMRSCSVLHRMLIELHDAIGVPDLCTYNGDFREEDGVNRLKGYAVLEQYGWTFADEAERQVLDGTHALYKIVKNGGELK